jgi:predicted double-glycine peptidase
MRLQDEQSACGAYALANAFEALLGPGNGLTADVCKQLTGYLPSKGVSAAGMRRAVQRAGYRPVRVTSMLELRGALSSGLPVMMLVDAHEHWIAAIGLLGSRVLIADAALGDLVLGVDGEALLGRWTHRRACYGLAASPKGA